MANKLNFPQTIQAQLSAASAAHFGPPSAASPLYVGAMSYWQSSWGSSGSSWRGSRKRSWSQQWQGSWGGSGSSDWCSSWVAASAADASEDPQRIYDEPNMEDMTQQELCREAVAVSRRTYKLGKAFQNWKRVQLKLLQDMQSKKVFFMTWRRAVQKDDNLLCLEDLLWTEDDMDNFLDTVASFETHERLWKQRRTEREDPSHPEHDKPMPLMIPPSRMHVFQMILSQTHSNKVPAAFRWCCP